VNSSGYVQFANANCFTYSNPRPSGTAWSATGTVTWNSSGGIADPIGGTNAQSFSLGTTGSAIFNTAGTIVVSGITHTFSVWLRAASGTTGARIGSANTGAVLTVALTETWQRFSCQYVTNGANDGGAVYSQTGTASTTMYVWGAQVQPGSIAGDLIQTSGTQNYSTPRFDYSPTNIGEPRGLLIEGQATNILKSSEEFSIALGYADAAILSRTTGTSPSNGTAVGFYPTLVNDYHRLSSIYQVGLSGAYTVSIWVKRLNSNYRAGINANTIFAAAAIFDLNGAGSVVALSGAATNKAATITRYPNDWYRLTVTGTFVTDSVVFCFMDSSTSTDATGGSFNPVTGSQGMLMWGFQIEAGSGASSYIPTGASGVMRTLDTCYMSGISSWFNESAGTVISNITYNGLATDNSGIELSVGTGISATNRIGIRKGYVDYYSGGVNSAELYPTITSGNVRIGSAYSLNDFAICSNGGDMKTDVTGAVPVGLNTLKLYADSGTSGLVINGLVKSIKYFPTRLSNSQLQQITNPTYVAPTLDLDFVPMTTGADLINKGITFTRLSNATFINSSGYIELAASNEMTYSQGQDSETFWNRYGTGVVRTAGQTDPNGGTSAVKLVYTATAGDAVISRSVPTSIGLSYTISMWMRADSGTLTNVRFARASTPTGAFFPTLTTTWQRVSMSFTASGANDGIEIRVLTAGSPQTATFHVYGAQLEAGSTVRTYQPALGAVAYYSPRFDNNILTSRTNLILQSNNFTIAAGTPWAQKDATHSVTLTTDTAPPGFSGTATKITALNSDAGITQALSVPAISGKTARISFYAKSNAVTEQTCFLQQSSSLLSTVTIPTTWTRIDLSAGANAITEITLKGFIDPLDISIYGMQVEYVTSGGATDYIPTTTASVTVNTTEPKGLLIEGATTNLCTYSNDFNNANWTRDGVANGALDPVVTPLYPSTGPDGALTVTRIVFDKINGASGVNGIFSRIRRTILSVPSNTYTMSVWMKANIANGAAGIQNVGLRMGSSAGVNCVVTTTWQRFTHTFAVTDGSAEFQIMLWDNITGPPVNSETADILVYGAQTELGFGASSYIPTGSTSTVLRVADHCTIPTSSFISGNPYPQTLFVDCIPNTPSGAYLDILRVFDRTVNSAFSYGNQIYYYNPPTMTASRKIAASTNTERSFATGLAYGTRHKFALSIDSSSFSGSYDGVTSTGVATAPTALPTVATHLGIGCTGDSAPNAVMFGTIRQIKFYPSALSQSQINTLTTL
jgi:hypothetical protein